MIYAATDRSSRAVRRAARTAGLTAALFTLLSLTDGWTRGTVTTPFLADGGVLHHLGFLVTVVALAPSVVLLPVAVRVLAHPGEHPLPAGAAASAATGVVVSLFWTAGGLGLLAARWLTSGGPAPTGSTPARIILAGAAATVVAGTLLTTEQIRGVRAATHGDGDRRSPAARPDLVDDLATLAARTFPGSGFARALAALNRRVDDWAVALEPQRRGGSNAPRLSRLAGAAISRISQTRPQPD